MAVLHSEIMHSRLFSIPQKKVRAYHGPTRLYRGKFAPGSGLCSGPSQMRNISPRHQLFLRSQVLDRTNATNGLLNATTSLHFHIQGWIPYLAIRNAFACFHLFLITSKEIPFQELQKWNGRFLSLLFFLRLKNFG